MTRLAYCVALLCVWACLASCQQWDLPSNEQVEQVFAPAQPSAMLKIPQPHDIQPFDTQRTEDWHTLCSQCHRGSTYSSFTILNWSHRAGCLKNSSCVECHGRKLHRMDVRGNKRICFNCHLAKKLPVDCTTCHVKGWKEQHTPHGKEYATSHGNTARADQQPCYNCHGSENWCTSCHGLPMPHPDDIRTTHPSLVRGKPEICAKCHGAKSCETCHTAKGILR